jgi:hypothetical protein
MEGSDAGPRLIIVCGLPGSSVELHYLTAPADVLFDRTQRRGVENPPIEREALSRWFEVFQAPTAEEMALFDEPLIAELASGSD